jgi:hypothetical protein
MHPCSRSRLVTFQSDEKKLRHADGRVEVQ